MMSPIKVKVFSSTQAQSIEEEFNAWFASKQPALEFIQVSDLRIYVFYRE